MKLRKNTKEALVWIVNILQKKKIPFQITGGFAAKVYGSKRALHDIDIELPEKYLTLLAPQIKRYITFGPALLKTKKWDVTQITLRYHGQEIDLCGAYQCKIYDEGKKKWVASAGNLKRSIAFTVIGRRIPFANPQELLSYKKLLYTKGHEHHKTDIEAIRQFMKR